MSRSDSRPSSWERLIGDAQAYLEDGELEEALAVCEQATELEPERIDGYLLASEILLRLDDPRSAAEAAREALELAPEEEAAIALLGASLFESCDFEGARTTLAPLLATFDGQAEAYFLSAVVAEREAETSEARRLYAEASRRDDTYRTVAPLDRERFDAVVEDAIRKLPDDVRAALENVSVQVEDFPPLEELRASNPPLSPLILGLFRGVPRAEKSVFDGGAAGIDTVVLYQRCLELTCRDEDELMEEIVITLVHEVGHYLGLSEEELVERGVG